MTLKRSAEDVDVAFTRTEPKGLSYENPFAGAVSFLRRRFTKDLAGVDLAVTGIPFDQAVTNRPGARFGPRALREASTPMAGDPPYGWGYSPLEAFAVADAGDMAFDFARPAEVTARIEMHIAEIIAVAKGCITLGGDHSTTLPNLRAHAAKHGPLSLLQFDAHSDTWGDTDPDRTDHGNFVVKAVAEGLIDPSRSVQVGIRVDNEHTLGITRIGAPDVHADGPAKTVERVKRILGDSQVYLSFDIDALDPAHAPGTGTPVWGGLSTAQAAAILRGLAGIDLAGGDVVEVSPPYDHAAITAMAGAHVGYELIALWGWTRR